MTEEDRRYKEFQVKSGFFPGQPDVTAASQAEAAASEATAARTPEQPAAKKRAKKEESDDQISFVLELEKKYAVRRRLIAQVWASIFRRQC